MPVIYTPNETVNRMAAFAWPKGDVIPHYWRQTIVTEKGKPDWLAMMILSHIAYQYMPYQEIDPNDGQRIVLKMKFSPKQRWYQISKNKLAREFGESADSVKARLDRLEALGVISRTVTAETAHDGRPLTNCLNIALNVERFVELTFPPMPDENSEIAGLSVEQDFKELKKASSKTVRKKTYDMGETVGLHHGKNHMIWGKDLPHTHGNNSPTYPKPIRESNTPNPNPYPDGNTTGAGAASALAGEGLGAGAPIPEEPHRMGDTGPGDGPSMPDPSAIAAAEADPDFAAAWDAQPPSKLSRRAKTAAAAAWTEAIGKHGVEGAFLAENYRRYVGYQTEAGTEGRYIAALSTWLSPSRPMEGWSLERALRMRAKAGGTGTGSAEDEREREMEREREEAEAAEDERIAAAMVENDPTARELYAARYAEADGLTVAERKARVLRWAKYFAAHKDEYRMRAAAV